MRSVDRRAFTVTELMVSIAVIGLLASLIAPAVQSARESSRRALCMNNLKQFGLAMASEVEIHRAFPTAPTPVPGYWRMLPHLGQSPLYESLISSRQAVIPSFPKNLTVSPFVCPDDGLHVLSVGNSNYLFNNGTQFRWVIPSNGFVKDSRVDTKPADIVDGLSNTAAMSERLVGVPAIRPPAPSEMEREPRRYFWFTTTRYNQRGEEQQARDECRNHRTTTEPQFAGVGMQLYAEGTAGYNHFLTPNQAACYNGLEDLGIDNQSFLIPPSSLHPNGVNVLFADGSVHFVSDGISDEIWQGLGTRDGSEATTISF